MNTEAEGIDMLGHGYISIQGSTLPNPVDYSIDFDRMERSYTTEAGKEVLYINGSDKARISASFNSTSRLKARLEALYHARSTVTVGVAGTSYIDTYIESFSASLVKDSETTPNTDGLWSVDIGFRQL